MQNGWYEIEYDLADQYVHVVALLAAGKSIKRAALLRAGQRDVLLPEGVFRIDPGERPERGGWFEVEYDPFDVFVVVIAPAL